MTATQAQLDVVAGVLSDPGNADLSAEEVAELVMSALEKVRKWNYVVIAQDRSPKLTTATLPGDVANTRTFVPTWVLGPFYTASEASKGAREMRAKGYRAMGAEIYGPDKPIEPMDLKEVLL